jgi:hypothetical protein
LALWVAQQEFLEETAAEHQKLLSEFEAALGRNQTMWTDQAKGLANQSLNAALRWDLSSANQARIRNISSEANLPQISTQSQASNSTAAGSGQRLERPAGADDERQQYPF